MKRYEEIRKLTTEKGEDYTTACLLDYDYLKNQYKLIAIDLSRQKELDTHHKVIQRLQFFWQPQNVDGKNNDGPQSIFVLAIREKNQRNEIEVFSRKCDSITNNDKLLRSQN